MNSERSKQSSIIFVKIKTKSFFWVCIRSFTKKTKIKLSVPKKSSQNLQHQPWILSTNLSLIWSLKTSFFPLRLPSIRDPLQSSLAPNHTCPLNGKIPLSCLTLEKYLAWIKSVKVKRISIQKNHKYRKLSELMKNARKEAEVETKKSPKTDKIPKVNLESKKIMNSIVKPSYVRCMKRVNAGKILLIAILLMASSS